MYDHEFPLDSGTAYDSTISITVSIGFVGLSLRCRMHNVVYAFSCSFYTRFSVDHQIYRTSIAIYIQRPVRRHRLYLYQRMNGR